MFESAASYLCMYILSLETFISRDWLFFGHSVGYIHFLTVFTHTV